MASYKVLQDVEAEDKLIGPLTLRQFIYAGISAVFLYLSFLVTTKGIPFMLVLFLPVALAFGFLAFPWGRDQPTEIWALAKVRFLLKPRRRVWDQDGMKELVTITVPKKIVHNYTNNLTQEEVRSRLRALADTIDTRGWAVKNAGYNLAGMAQDSDRLVTPVAPVKTDTSGVTDSDDMLDENNNAGAKRMQDLISKSSKERRDKIVENLNKKEPPKKAGKPANDYWFLNQPSAAAKVPSDMVTFNTQVVTPGAKDDSAAAASKDDEASVMAELDKHKQDPSGAYYGHMRTIQPLSKQKAAAKKKAEATKAAATPAPSAPPAAPAAAQKAPAAPAATPKENANAPVTPAQQTAILQLANNNDLNVATLAREAEKAAPQNEVVIKLH